jgi:hypothetical protein
MPYLSAHGHHGDHHTSHIGGDTTYLDSHSGHFSTYGLTTEDTIRGQAYGGNNSTYRGSEYYHGGSNAESKVSSYSGIRTWLTLRTMKASSSRMAGFNGDIGIHDMPVYDPYRPGDSLRLELGSSEN